MDENHRNHWSNQPWPYVTGLGVVVALLMTITIDWDGALKWWSGKADPHESIRNLLLILGGIGGVALATWRSMVANRQARTAEHNARTAEQGHITDRFSAAVKHLGSAELPVRMGGIYALWRLAEDSAARDEITVWNILCAFVRNPPHEPELIASQLGGGGQEGVAEVEAGPVRPDVQSILDLLGATHAARHRLQAGYSMNLAKSPLYQADLRDADLSNADLSGADLSGAYLNRANLSGTYLYKAGLRGAYLNRANLSSAKLVRAKLSGSFLIEANLSGANLFRANLSSADLSGADLRDVELNAAELRGADLSGADLSGAKLIGADLSGANLKSADLSGAILRSVKLSESDLSAVELSGADLSGADLSFAKLRKNKFISQDLLETARPTLPPLSLPDELIWPFIEIDGKWVLKEK